MAMNTYVLTPEDGFVQVGDGPVTILLKPGSSDVTVADAAEAPDDTFTGDAYLLRNTGELIDLNYDNLPFAKVEHGTATVWTQPYTPPVEEVSQYQPSKGAMVKVGEEYAAGTAIGGLLDVQGLGSANSGTLISAILRVKGEQTAKFKLYLFGDLPTTPIEDGGAITALADEPYLRGMLGAVTLEAPDTGLGVSIYLRRGINQVIVGAQRLYGVLVADAAITFDDANAISLEVGLQLSL